MVELREEIRAAIAAAADPAVAQKVKQAVPGARTLGVPVPHLRQLAAGVRRDRPDLSLEDAGDLMDALCRDGWREEILVGAFLLGRYGRRLARLPWNRLQPWIAALDNWETCDQLASNVAGVVVAAHLELVDELVALTGSANPWQRRFALATAAVLNHKGRSHPAETLRICLPLLNDPEATVRKAVGWALKEASKRDEKAVFAFLQTHRAAMPAGILREAASKLSPGQQEMLRLGL